MFDSRKSQICDSEYGEWMRAQIAFGWRKRGICEGMQRKKQKQIGN